MLRSLASLEPADYRGKVRGWVNTGMRRARELWRRALNEHSTPREIGWSVALGVFSGCTPLLGLHMWIALALATIFRKNRLWAFLGSRISSNVLFLWITFVEIELGHRLRTAQWAPVAPREAMAQAKSLAIDWFLGAAIVGCLLGAAIGTGAYFATRRWQRERSDV